MTKILLDTISIRTELRPGDIGMITHLHGTLYQREYGYGVAFESYVAQGLAEFYNAYDPASSRIWIAEHDGKMVGSLVLLNRGAAAQLRYFLIVPECRGIGLGNKLMNLFDEFLAECNYTSAYLWTTDELPESAHLYTKHGFKRVATKDSNTFGKAVTEVKYERNL